MVTVGTERRPCNGIIFGQSAVKDSIVPRGSGCGVEQAITPGSEGQGVDLVKGGAGRAVGDDGLLTVDTADRECDPGAVRAEPGHSDDAIIRTAGLLANDDVDLAGSSVDEIYGLAGRAEIIFILADDSAVFAFLAIEDDEVAAGSGGPVEHVPAIGREKDFVANPAVFLAGNAVDDDTAGLAGHDDVGEAAAVVAKPYRADILAAVYFLSVHNSDA